MMKEEISEDELKALTLRVVQVAFHNNRDTWQCWRFLLNKRARIEMNNQVISSTWTQEVIASPASGREARDILAAQIKNAIQWRSVLLVLQGVGALLWSRFEPTLWHHTKWGFLTSAFCLVLTFAINHSIDIRLVRRWDGAWSHFRGSETQVPMKGAEFLLWFFLPRESREAAIGDTNDKFDMMLERFGPRRAKLWYWGEVVRSAWPLISYLGERLLKWTFFGSIADWVRRHI